MTYTIGVCTVKKKTPDDGRRNCPKHVEFHSKNKSEKSVHLVGFIITKLKGPDHIKPDKNKQKIKVYKAVEKTIAGEEILNN